MGPKPINQKEQFGLLQEKVKFEDFNPDSCELSKELFFNHTRQQLKDVKI